MHSLLTEQVDHRPLENFAANCGPGFQSLRLQNCDIYHRGFLSFPMLNENTITNINLNCNYLGDEGAKILAESFFPCQMNIRYVRLKECYIRNDGFLGLMEALVVSRSRNKNKVKHNIVYYDLSCNVITDPAMITFAKEIAPRIPEYSLDYLNLIGNWFTANIGNSMGNALTANAFCRHLKLEDTCGSTAGRYGGCISVDEIRHAEEFLSINNRAMCDICGSVIAQMIIPNDNILRVNLSQNRFTNRTAALVFEAVLDHGSICELDLSCNNVDLGVPAFNKRIFDSCNKAKKLTKLRLDRNGINNDGMWSIVSFIGSDPPLEMLSIQGNNFYEKKCFEILVNNLKLNRTLIWLDLRYNPGFLNQLVMTGDGYSMLAFQLNRSNKDLVCPPFHDVDMENKELAQDQEYMHKFRERMLEKIRTRIKSPGEMDQASNLWCGRVDNYLDITQ